MDNLSSQPVAQVRPSQRKPKEDYEEWVAIAMEILHSKQTRGAIQDLLKSGASDPVNTMAKTLGLVLTKLDQSSRNSGQEVDDAVKLLALAEVENQLVEIAEALGAFTLDEAHKELALSIAVQDYVKSEVAAGRINPVKLQAQMATSVSKMPPAERMAMEKSLQRIQQTAKSYAARKQGGLPDGNANTSV